MKKLSIVLAICMLSVMMLSACSGKDSSNGSEDNSAADQTSDQGTDTSASGPVEISLQVPQGPDTDYATNKFTKLVEDKLNIKIDWVIAPMDAATEKRQLALSSGDYPTAFISQTWIDQFTPSDLMKLGKQGVLVPLNDLIDQYAPNIKKNLTDKPEVKAALTAPDGNIYGLSAINECYHCSFGSKMWINQVWLDKLNLEMPKTTEDFKKVLEAFKNDDPNGNGKKDEVPLSGANGSAGMRVTTFLMNAFIYNDDANYLEMNNGKVDLAAMQPQWKEGLKYIASLYKEGLIDPGAFTQNGDAYYQLGNHADVSMIGAAAAMHPAIFINLGANPLQKDYQPVPPLTGPQGVSLATYGQSISGFNFVVTSKANKEQQIALIKLADYLATEEGTTLETMGEEGVNWKKADATDIGLDGNPAAYATIQRESKPDDKPLNNAWGEIGPFVKTKEYRASWGSPMDTLTPAGYERRLFNATQLYDGHQPKEVFPSVVYMDETTNTEASLLQTNIKKYVEENMLQFITGAKDIDSSWDSYISGFKNLKVDRLMELYQQALDNMKK
ncbi:sugar ABC transporter substrate-binding protein [Paenibacillus sp. CCS19]|uniref:extracellular solute-binding protein n=1 Tax=Paenibacillus sp. CCS19 TaxID=3158387 RepID=UPI002566B6D2|nr:extracellular solute-binding protein [Paenibacillus cellulosilyticus]GMK38612.1 sugar ABC transporter substrate-binding protein [Paenibacillus cellulosilyticus]